jgi:L-ascorbate metabolism protein UlaG (beta-lactamase superfamily)
MLEKIFWLGHSSVKIRSGKTIYIDPWKLKRNAEPADLILVSHSHRDHLSPEDIKKVRKKDTVIVAPADCAVQLSGDVKIVKPGDRVDLSWLEVEATHAYNPERPYHPRGNGWVGFVLTVEGKRIYYCGDTNFIAEMENIRADIMIVPVGGTYTMNAEEAAHAVNRIRPEAAIPIHYGDVVGSLADAMKFKALCSVNVEIKPVS